MQQAWSSSLSNNKNNVHSWLLPENNFIAIEDGVNAQGAHRFTEISKISATSTRRRGECRNQGADGYPVVLANIMRRIVLAIDLFIANRGDPFI